MLTWLDINNSATDGLLKLLLLVSLPFELNLQLIRLDAIVCLWKFLLEFRLFLQPPHVCLQVHFGLIQI